jgi:flavin-dependent dehydrogenase
MTDEEEEIVDVIVVGAGISGLYAAYRIKQKSPELKVLVLEAKGKSTKDKIK